MSVSHVRVGWVVWSTGTRTATLLHSISHLKKKKKIRAAASGYCVCAGLEERAQVVAVEPIGFVSGNSGYGNGYPSPFQIPSPIEFTVAPRSFHARRRARAVFCSSRPSFIRSRLRVLLQTHASLNIQVSKSATSALSGPKRAVLVVVFVPSSPYADFSVFVVLSGISATVWH